MDHLLSKENGLGQSHDALLPGAVRRPKEFVPAIMFTPDDKKLLTLI